MSALIYRKAFHDFHSLSAMLRGDVPQMDDIRRRIFVSERRSDTGLANHFYKNYLDARLGDVEHVHALPQRVLTALAERFLTRAGGRLHIKAKAFADWQKLLPSISPLAVIIAFLVEEGRGPQLGEDPRPFLYEQIGDTALLQPHQPELLHLIENDGLNEMHMHLNGSTELDIVWADAVKSPELYKSEMHEALSKQKKVLQEFYDQIHVGLRPYAFFTQLMVTRRIRHLTAKYLAEHIQHPDPQKYNSGLYKAFFETMKAGCRDYEDEEVASLALSQTPISTIYPGRKSTPLIEEAALLYTWLTAYKHNLDLQPSLGLTLYFNMLMVSQVARISVQQIDEVGFDQFQNYTLIGVREKLERHYEARFRQLNGKSPYKTLSHLEGRIAGTKKDVGGFLKLVDAAVTGFLRFRGCIRNDDLHNMRGFDIACLNGTCQCGGRNRQHAGRDNAEFVLVVHFIKRPPSKTDLKKAKALDHSLRKDLRINARVVREAMQSNAIAGKVIRGIDAAANELHAAPEVFAPTFRYMRHHCIERSTYHAGEDFIHLVSGIRACAEAHRFLPLREGDRMGHATALGISPRLWLERSERRMMVPIGEHLDNLVYAHHVLAGHVQQAATAKMLESEIATLSSRIYGEEISPTRLHSAWSMRNLDILEILDLENNLENGATPSSIAAAARAKSRHVFQTARVGELNMIAKAAEEDPQPYEIYRKRHTLGKKLLKQHEVCTGWLDAQQLSFLQASMLRAMADSRCAIETLPMSNVRISLYDILSEHHLFRWLGLTDEPFDIVPAICVGSDDTGIFSTSMHNEYAAIFDVLTYSFNMKRHDAVEIIKKLNNNGSAYRFKPYIEKHEYIDDETYAYA